MTRWIKEEYEGVIAFLFISVGAVLPWNVSSAIVPGLGINIYHIRWWFGQIRHITSQINGFQNVYGGVLQQQGTAVFPAFVLWGITTIVFTLAVLLAIALLIREETVTKRINVHRVAGGLLTLSGLGYIASSIIMTMNGFPGIYIPVGALLLLLFGGILLTNRSTNPLEALHSTTAALTLGRKK
jgi:uncharacterized protein (TIGR04206 family)